MKRIATLSVAVSLLCTASAWAADAYQPLSTGVVFPGLNQASLVDAAGLPNQSGSALGLHYAPGSATGSTYYDAGYAYANGNWGVDVGYQGSQGLTTQSGLIWAGAAAKFSEVSLGFGMIRPMASTSLIPGFDLSLQIGSGSGVQFGADFTGLPTTISTMTLGIGYRENHKYSLEAGVQAPWVTQLFSAGSNPTFLVGAGIFPGAIGLTMQLSAASSNFSPQLASLGVTWDLSQKLRLTGRWISTNSTVYASSTFNQGPFTLGVTINVN